VNRTTAAERMRAHRQRRRAGLRCVTVELRETEVDVLIQQKLLAPDARNDPCAIRNALHTHFDRTLATPTAQRSENSCAGQKYPKNIAG
jgi:hypothetical protein